MTQGKKANIAGKRISYKVQNYLMDKGFAKTLAKHVSRHHKNVFAVKYPYTKLQGTQGKSMLIINNHTKCRLHCQGQQVAGSVDMKVYGVLETMKRAYREPCFFLLEGDILKPLRIWAKKEVKSVKRITVGEFSDFKKWIKIIKEANEV